MKPFIAMILVICNYVSHSQQTEFFLQGQVVDPDKNPISDAYIICLRDQSQHISRQNGTFDIWLLPPDSVLVTHVTFLRKIISAFDLLNNPVIMLEPDTIVIGQVTVYSSKKTDYERAMENIKEFEFDPRPLVKDSYSESERMKQLLQTENKLERAAANALTYQFSPSEVIGKMVGKIRSRKKKNKSDTKKE